MAHRVTKPTEADMPGIGELGSGLWGLVLGYLKQETLEPVKALGRYVAFGLAGSVLAAIGFVLLIEAGLRAMEEDGGSAFHGSLSWLPYLICAVAAMVIVALAGLRIVRRPGGSR
ncbi:MAG: hypothetical protein ACRDX8_03800 [Acidimicrobiales bacterium]